MKSALPHRRTSLANTTIKLCLMIFTCLAMASTSWAANYYVDKNHSNASDSNPGTESSPWKTIQKGANVAVAGDTVYVKSGTYNEKVAVGRSGSSGKPITFKAYPGDTPIIDGTGISLNLYSGLFESRGNDYITIDGFEVRNSSEVLIRMSNGTHLTIKNCIAHANSGSGGAGTNRSGIFIDHCDVGLVENNEAYNTGHNAISGESVSNVTFQYNYVHGNPNHAGINIFPKTSETQSEYSGNDIKYNILTECATGIYSRYQTYNEISNNLIYNNVNNGIYLEKDSIDPHVFASHTLIANNTITGNGQNGILNGNATYLTIQNNIIYNNRYSNIYIRSGATTGNVISHNLSNDPGFTNKSGNDYTLQSDSPAIDAGVNLTGRGVTDDIDGNSRPQGKGFDIGAYEFNSDPSTTVLNAPTNLRIYN